MPRRPDPETGLVPTEEVGYAMQADVSPPRRTLMRAYDDSSPLDYSQLERMVADTRAIISSSRDMPQHQPQGMAMQVYAERDLQHGGANIHVRAVDHRRDTMAVIENITWRAVQPGEEAPSSPFRLSSDSAEQLVEQLRDFNPQARRAQQYREQRDQAQSELRSLSNQLSEIRNHNETLVRTNEEQQRQIRWLERELRDANQERRAQG